jgi:hypothetical protein
MSTERTITIRHGELKETAIVLRARGSGSKRHLVWVTVAGDWQAKEEDRTITLTEQEICEYSAKALKELSHAEEAMHRAEDRADALRKFSQQLYGAAATLQVVKE